MKLFFYRAYQFTVMLPMMLIVTIITASTIIIACMMGLGRWVGYVPEKWWARIMCALTLVRVSVKGREHLSKGQPYVFVCNHQGAYDIFSVYGYLGHDFRWMMKQSLRKIPLVGLACAKAGHIFVDNSSPRAVRATMEAAEAKLRRGMSIVVFPEGARSWTGKMRPFKRGAYQLATEFNLPVVPVTIDGSYEVLPRHKKLCRWGHITLTIHPVINPPAEGYDLPTLMQQSYDAIHSSLPERHK